jgi:hypothetical protein
MPVPHVTQNWRRAMSDEQELLDVVHSWADAELAGDSSAHSELLDPDSARVRFLLLWRGRRVGGNVSVEAVDPR